MEFIKRKLIVLLLPKILEKPCDETIPRSGEKGKKVNCFVARIRQKDEPEARLTHYEAPDFYGQRWNGSEFSQAEPISLDELTKSSLLIVHYWGFVDIRFQGIVDYLVSGVTRYIYIKTSVIMFYDKVAQFLFNKRKFETKRRHELLKFLVREYMGSKNGFGYVGVLHNLHSSRIFSHPDLSGETVKIMAHLNALVDTGELRMDHGNYHITGLAFKTLSEYEDENRKHKANLWMQGLIIVLTLLVVFGTMVQANLIKLKPWIDLTTL